MTLWCWSVTLWCVVQLVPEDSDPEVADESPSKLAVLEDPDPEFAMLLGLGGGPDREAWAKQHCTRYRGTAMPLSSLLEVLCAAQNM